MTTAARGPREASSSLLLSIFPSASAGGRERLFYGQSFTSRRQDYVWKEFNAELKTEVGNIDLVMGLLRLLHSAKQARLGHCQVNKAMALPGQIDEVTERFCWKIAHSHTHVCAHTCAHTLMHTRTLAHRHAHTQACRYTHTHRGIHIHTQSVLNLTVK